LRKLQHSIGRLATYNEDMAKEAADSLREALDVEDVKA
jgi:hypothetical protein